MNFVKKFFRILWRDHRDGRWFLFFPVFGIYYFFIQHIGLEYRVIHISLDDKIPFVPAFVIPYILWYLYIPATLCYVWLKDKRGFRKQLWCLYPGMILCYVLFVLFPTTVDFRPADPGSGFFAFLCRIIYSTDNPVNVFPSLHCYEAVVAHLTTFTRGPLRHNLPLRISSALLTVLICLSTVFVKQHSVLDVAAGTLLALLSFVVCSFIFRRKERREAAAGVPEHRAYEDAVSAGVESFPARIGEKSREGLPPEDAKEEPESREQREI